MDNNTIIHSLLYNIFPDSSSSQTALLLQDDKINELIRYIPNIKEKGEIDFIMNTLKDNFTEIRMNAARFVQTSIKDIYYVLFKLFLSFDDINPPISILNCLEILLIHGYSKRFTFKWLFKQIKMKIKKEEATAVYLSNYLKIIKYFYGYIKNNQDIQSANNHSSNYFYFFPTKRKSNGLVLFIEENTNFDFNKSIGISTWFKFPLKKNNVHQMKELYRNEPVEIIKIPFGNDKHITIQILFNPKENVSLIQILQNDFLLRMRNTQNDDIIHIYLECNSKSLKIWVNGNKMEIPSIEAFPMNRLNKILFYNNFFGEVYSIIIYSNPTEMMCNNEQSQENINSFNEYYDSFFITQKTFRNKPCLVYFPYGKGGNLCKNYPNNLNYQLMFPKKGFFIYNHCSYTETVNKYYGVNALLPIFEYIYTHNTLSDIPDLINSLFESIQMFPLYHQYKTKEDLNKDFFFVISMFLEKMPNNYFNELFGKRLFNSLDTFVVFNKQLFVDYANNIFFNDIILLKYGSNFIPWTFVFIMKQSSKNGDDVLELLSIRQMINALLSYDNNKDKEFCCDFHKNSLTQIFNSDINVMEPNLNYQIKSLVSLIITKLKMKKDIMMINQKETNESDLFDANEGQKELLEKKQDLLFVSKTLSLSNSPCMMLQLLHIMNECFSSYDKEIFKNCKLSMYSPFLDVKNKCIDLLIRFINSSNSHLDQHKIGKLLSDFFLPFLPTFRQDTKALHFTKEYIDKSTNDILNTLIDWIIPLSKEIKVPIDNISEEIEDPYIKKIIPSFKMLIEQIISNLQADNNMFHPLIQNMVNILLKKLNAVDHSEINKLNILCDKNHFRNKLHCIIDNSKEENVLGNCYTKCIIFYYHLITSTLSVTEMVEEFQIILSILLAKNSLKCSQQSQANFFYNNLIGEALQLYMTINQSTNGNILNHIIDLISISFSYFIFIINYNKLKQNNERESELKFGLFNLSTVEDSYWINFNSKILSNFSKLWVKSQFEFTKNTISQIFDDFITNVNKEDLNNYQNEIYDLIRVKQENKGILPLIIIISFIYINEILRLNESNKSILKDYGQFLFYVIVLSILDSNTINLQTSQTYFLEVIVLGLNILNLIKRKNNTAEEILQSLIKSLMHFKKQLKCFKKLNQKANNILSIIASKKTEERAILLLMSFIASTTNSTQSIFTNSAEIKEVDKSKLSEESQLIIENYLKQLSMFITDRTQIARDKQDELKQLKQQKQENIDGFILNHNELINQSYIKERKKRMRYYKIKKKLFLWNDPWSDKELFYPYNKGEETLLKEKRTMKILNHYTQSFTRPFLIPILDVEFQLPQFSSFNSSTLFQSDYSISTTQMNINDILDKHNLNALTISCNKIQENSTLSTILYGESDAYYQKQKDYKNDATYTIPSKKTCELLTQIRNQSNSNSTCCLVKSSHHIKGTFHIENEIVEFKPFINRNFYKSSIEENDIDYDTKKETCFGSYIRNFKKDYNKTEYLIPFNSIIYIFQRSYMFRDTGIEIFTNDNKSYYFTFLSENTQNEIYSTFTKLLSERVFILNFQDLNNPFFDFIKDWVKGSKSNLFFLMRLNLGANRSFNDLSQYPVLPWVITDYSSQTIPNQKSHYRDLSLPIGMITLENKPKSYERQQEYLSNFESLDDSNEALFPPYYYGSFYSNPLYVTHYLVRLFPMSVITIEIQGDKFDDPNRLFFSVEQSFENAMTQKGDVRELVPEFYFLPEIFINHNNFNYGFLRNKTKVHDVECPLWAEKDPYKFVVLMRKFFEDDYVSSQLHLWVDLIFGSKQRGEGAIKAKNVFLSSGYSDNLKIKDRTESIEFHYRMAEFGLIPRQLFSIPIDSKSKKPLSILKMNIDQVTHHTLEKCFPLAKNSVCKMTPVKMLTLNKLFFKDTSDEIMCFTYKLNTYEKSISPFGLKLPLIDCQTNKSIVPLITNRSDIYKENNVCFLLLDQGNTVLQGGFFDGNLLYSTRINSMIICTHNDSPICILTSSKDESIILAGTENGTIMYFKKRLNNIPTLVWTIYPHRKEVINLCISIELNAFASTSKDDYVNIYTLPKLKMIRSYTVKESEHVFLSESPLASIAIYTSKYKAFVCYSINGHLLKTVHQEKPKYPKMFKDSSFFDYLISLYTTNQIYIQSFPYLDKVLIVNIDRNLLPIIIFDVEDNLKSITLWSQNKQELYRLKDFQ